jgi:hypothetical protein
MQWDGFALLAGHKSPADYSNKLWLRLLPSRARLNLNQYCSLQLHELLLESALW